jgi:hypothetical protein
MAFPRVYADNALCALLMPGVPLPRNRPSWSDSPFYSIFICSSFLILSDLYCFPVLFSSHSIPLFHICYAVFLIFIPLFLLTSLSTPLIFSPSISYIIFFTPLLTYPFLSIPNKYPAGSTRSVAG